MGSRIERPNGYSPYKNDKGVMLDHLGARRASNKTAKRIREDRKPGPVTIMKFEPGMLTHVTGSITGAKNDVSAKEAA